MVVADSLCMVVAVGKAMEVVHTLEVVDIVQGLDVEHRHKEDIVLKEEEEADNHSDYTGREEDILVEVVDMVVHMVTLETAVREAVHTLDIPEVVLHIDLVVVPEADCPV